MYCQNPNCSANAMYRAREKAKHGARSDKERARAKTVGYPSLEREEDGEYHCPTCGWTSAPGGE